MLCADTANSNYTNSNYTVAKYRNLTYNIIKSKGYPKEVNQGPAEGSGHYDGIKRSFTYKNTEICVAF